MNHSSDDLDVGEVLEQPLPNGTLVGPERPQRQSAEQIRHVASVSFADRVRRARMLKVLAAIGAHRLQHSVPGRAIGRRGTLQQRAIDQLRDDVDDIELADAIDRRRRRGPR